MTTPADYSQAQRREAADWFVVINAEDDPSPETLQTWLQWMEADEGNQRAFEAIAQIWHSTPRSWAALVPTRAEVAADEYDAEQSVAEWMADRKSAPATPAAAGLARSRALRRKWWALAAASLAAVSIGGFEMIRYLRAHGAQSDEFATRAGEQIEITLADGSEVWLGPESRLVVNFSAAKRRLQLAQGEAYFSVRKDKARPFVVHSEGGDITAVGTAFNVRDSDREVTVAVSEGVVTVAPLEQPRVSASPETVRVASGQQLTFNAEAPVTSLAIKTSPAPGERARWRDGILVYRDEPLRSVIKDVARYRAKPLEITDPTVGDLRYSGVVYTKALDEWLAALPESFPVRVVSSDEQQEILPR
jgi:transmembrane sensor